MKNTPSFILIVYVWPITMKCKVWVYLFKYIFKLSSYYLVRTKASRNCDTKPV